MACDSLLTTSLLQVVHRLVQTDCAYLLPTGLLQVVSTSCNKSANDNLQQQTWKFKEIDSFVAIFCYCTLESAPSQMWFSSAYIDQSCFFLHDPTRFGAILNEAE